MRFKEAVRSSARSLVLRHPATLLWLNGDVELCLTLEMAFPREDIYSASWPKAAKHRHKRLDVSNRIKMLEDALMEAFDLNDAQVFTLVVTKRVTREGEAPHTKVLLSR